jgi:integrase
LNEVLRLKLSQIHFDKKRIVLLSTKTDAERAVPMSSASAALVRQRAKDGIAADGLVFAHSVSRDFDVVVREYVEIVAKRVGLNYGRADGGFTLHSLRHTFITDLLSRGVDVATCMRLSGHRSLQSFSVYLHETEFGRLKAAQTIEAIDGCWETVDGSLTGSYVAANVGGVEAVPLMVANA